MARSSGKRKASENGRGVFRISLTAVYNNGEMDADVIADDLFAAMTKVGRNLALLHVDSVKRVAKPEQAIAKILSVVSGSGEPMSMRRTDDGRDFVEVDGKTEGNDAK